MAAGLPDFRMHDDRSFQAHDIIAELGHGAPPGFFDIALEFSAQWTVIPESVQAAVNLRGLKNETPAFAQGDNLLH